MMPPYMSYGDSLKAILLTKSHTCTQVASFCDLIHASFVVQYEMPHGKFPEKEDSTSYRKQCEIQEVS